MGEEDEYCEVTGMDRVSSETRRLAGGVVSRLERREEDTEKESKTLLVLDREDEKEAEEFRRQR
jgi:hypothetical protein